METYYVTIHSEILKFYILLGCFRQSFNKYIQNLKITRQSTLKKGHLEPNLWPFTHQ